MSIHLSPEHRHGEYERPLASMSYAEKEQEIRELEAWITASGWSMPLSPQQIELIKRKIDENDAELLKVKGKSRRHRNRK